MVGCLKFPGRRVIALSFPILLGLCIPNMVSASSHYEGEAAIQQADEALSSAFQAVLEAEDARANVSVLVGELNEAACLLGSAKISLQNGDMGDGTDLASRAVEISESVEDEASGLRVSALSQYDFVFKVSLIGSFAGVASFLVFMFFLWRWFKDHYVRRISGLKPQVTKD